MSFLNSSAAATSAVVTSNSNGKSNFIAHAFYKKDDHLLRRSFDLPDFYGKPCTWSTENGNYCLRPQPSGLQLQWGNHNQRISLWRARSSLFHNKEVHLPYRKNCCQMVCDSMRTGNSQDATVYLMHLNSPLWSWCGTWRTVELSTFHSNFHSTVVPDLLQNQFQPTASYIYYLRKGNDLDTTSFQ